MRLVLFKHQNTYRILRFSMPPIVSTAHLRQIPPHAYNHLQLREELFRLQDRIHDAIYQRSTLLNIRAWKSKEPLSFAQRQTGEEVTLHIGDTWGELFHCAWFQLTGEAPQTPTGKELVLLLDINGEGCLVNENGLPVRGITNGSSCFDQALGAPGKRVVRDPQRFLQDGQLSLWVDAGCNDLFGMLQDNGRIVEACFALEDTDIRALYYDVEVLLDLFKELAEDSLLAHRILNAFYEALLLLGKITPTTAKAAREILAPVLAQKNGDLALQATAIGHAHLDLAWLWPLRESRRKAARTVATVFDLMERYPDYKFVCSQPQMYQWIKEDHPDLYAKLKDYIKAGRWEVAGALWVEADNNLAGGEALVRQLLYGKKFYRDEFGVEVDNVFLPDAFGYTAALPQLMKKAGVNYFITIKMSWDKFSPFPFHSFIWKGLDGSKVLAHLPPEGTYNSPALPRSFTQAEAKYNEKAFCDDFLVLYGIGDGGGGPGAEHLERLDREKDLQGMPRVKQDTVKSFFEKLEDKRDKLPTWVGEMFLHMHTGTFTTQGKTKRGNRKMELLLRDAELYSTLAMIQTDFIYPAREIETLWKEVLLYQFHDILPGSSITRVYDECVARYEEMEKQAEELCQRAIDALAARAPSSSDHAGVYNAISFDRSEWIKINNQWGLATVAALSGATVTLLTDMWDSVLEAEADLLENSMLRIEFANDGSIDRIYDKEHEREVLALGQPGNLLSIYEDTGDAWDFPRHTRQRLISNMKLKSSKATVDGPKSSITQVYTFGTSCLKQEIILYNDSRRIDFVSQLDWTEDACQLRVSFPVNVWATHSTNDIQFGHIQRPTHNNSAPDQGKYEQYAHKWVDLSDSGYGVALMNDCKYGHYVKGNVLDLHLVRSPSYPDPKADRGYHQFTYALFPHVGDIHEGGVIQSAHELNIPLRVVPPAVAAGCMTPFILTDQRNILVESVKKAENNNDIIVRLYEAKGQTTLNVSLEPNFLYDTAYLANLMEDNLSELEINDQSATLNFTPFEIHTIRFVR